MHTSAHPREVAAPSPPPPPRTRQTPTAPQSGLDTSPLAAMPVLPLHTPPKPKPPRPPHIERAVQSSAEYPTTHCDSSASSSCPRSLSTSQTQPAVTLFDPSSSSDCQQSREKSLSLLASSRPLGPIISKTSSLLGPTGTTLPTATTLRTPQPLGPAQACLYSPSSTLQSEQ
jgi:hypothetical protein